MFFDLTPAPSIGEHTAAVLGDVIGLGQEELELMNGQAGAASRNAVTNRAKAAS
jgi:hypothetical protein